MLTAPTLPLLVPVPLGNPLHPLMVWARENEIASLKEMAERLGVSKSRLSQIVARKNRPNAELLLKIVRETSLPIEVLLDLTPAEIRAGVRAGWEKSKRRPRRAK